MMEDLASDFTDHLFSAKDPQNNQPYAPAYLTSYLKAIKSWAEWNRKKFDRQIKIAHPKRRSTLDNERAPEPDEVRKVLYADTSP
jgi:hypothetical protein